MKFRLPWLTAFAVTLIVVQSLAAQAAADAKPAGTNQAPAPRHWAFIAPVKSPLPRVQDQKWAHDPIDRFILAKLESEKLKPSPEADRITLLRRLSLDLVGLPPTIAELDAFVADKSKDAYAQQ